MHSVRIHIHADQEIEINGIEYNIHDIAGLVLTDSGEIERVITYSDIPNGPRQEEWCKNNPIIIPNE